MPPSIGADDGNGAVSVDLDTGAADTYALARGARSQARTGPDRGARVAKHLQGTDGSAPSRLRLRTAPSAEVAQRSIRGRECAAAGGGGGRGRSAPCRTGHIGACSAAAKTELGSRCTVARCAPAAARTRARAALHPHPALETASRRPLPTSGAGAAFHWNAWQWFNAIEISNGHACAVFLITRLGFLLRWST